MARIYINDEGERRQPVPGGRLDRLLTEDPEWELEAEPETHEWPDSPDDDEEIGDG